jgi:uncharacterized protein (DUF58 family)
MIVPTGRTVLLVAIGIPPTMVGVLVEYQVWLYGLAWLVAVVLFTALDGLLAISGRRFPVSFDTPPVLYVGERDPCLVRFDAIGSTGRKTEVDILLDVAGVLPPIEKRRVRVDHDRDMRLRIELAPGRRGIASVHRAWLRWTGPLGLLARHVRYPIAADIPVLPNLRAVRQSALFISARQSFFGSKVQRERGSGSEFDALRDHVPGLDNRAIDWKHSARHRKLVSKEFQAERNHPLVLAVDCGRLMSEPLEGIAKLDHAINAGLVLAYAGLHAGDRVGVLGFDSEVRHYTAPSGGVRAFPRLQEAFAQFDYRETETNFTLALTELLGRLDQRSLVVVITDFVDTITAELMIENVGRLASRHVVLFVTLRDPALADAVERLPRDLEGLAQAVIAGDMARERDLVLERLKRLGVLCLETEVGRLNTDLVNRYLSVKTRELV